MFHRFFQTSGTVGLAKNNSSAAARNLAKMGSRRAMRVFKNKANRSEFNFLYASH